MTYKKSWQRPLSVTQEHFDSEYDRIFNKGDRVAITGVRNSDINGNYIVDALAGDGDTFEEKVSLSDEMQLHGDKHKPEGL